MIEWESPCPCRSVSSCLDCRRAYQRAYYASNKDKYRVWHADNHKLPSSRAALKRYEDKNREKRREKNRKWYRQNKEYRKQYNREWIRANPEKREMYDANAKGKRRGGAGSFTAQEWQAIVKKQGGKCAHCNKKCRLTKDHIIPLARGGSNYAFNIQGLCHSCNSRKHARIESGAQHSLFDTTRLLHKPNLPVRRADTSP